MNNLVGRSSIFFAIFKRLHLGYALPVQNSGIVATCRLSDVGCRQHLKDALKCLKTIMGAIFTRIREPIVAKFDTPGGLNCIFFD